MSALMLLGSLAAALMAIGTLTRYVVRRVLRGAAWAAAAVRLPATVDRLADTVDVLTGTVGRLTTSVDELQQRVPEPLDL